MTNLTRRRFTALAGASLGARHAAVRARRARPGQAEARGDRRRTRRRHGRALRQQGPDGRDRGDADRAAEEFHHLLLLQHLCRRLPRLQVDHPHLRQGAQGGREGRARGRGLDRPRQDARSCSPAASAFPTTGSWSRPASTSSSTRVPGYSEAAARGHAARLEARRADRAAGQEAQRAEGRRHHRDDRAAQSLSLPARALRARLDVRACAQDRRGTRNRRSSCSIRSRTSPSRRCSWKAGRSTIPA